MALRLLQFGSEVVESSIPARLYLVTDVPGIGAKKVALLTGLGYGDLASLSSPIVEDDLTPANLDSVMDSRRRELKSPGSGGHAVEDRLHDAFVKSGKFGIDEPSVTVCNSESARGGDDVYQKVIRGARHRTKTKSLALVRIIFLSHDGSRLSLDVTEGPNLP